MVDIVLLTFNARYHHASFGLRYLKANMGELGASCEILEFDLEARPADVLERILGLQPRIIGLSVYIWNTRQSLEFARLLKAVRPDVILILGGPEVSYEHEGQPMIQVADYVLCGEADVAFAQLCHRILSGLSPEQKVISAPLPDLAAIKLPYHLYTDEDVRHRTVYVESSRGCPFSCEFCLSSLDTAVRRFPLEPFLAEMQKLIDRGARQFKFVDRTFNVNAEHAAQILGFFLRVGSSGAPATDDLFLHFEIVPDHLPVALRDLLAQFPAGTLQLEIGVQTFDEEVAERIGRRQDNAMVEANLRFLREKTSAHIHADLIAGLPGESLDGFAVGFDRLLALRPHEIQLGILKHLRGATIARHTESFGIVYSPDAPYEIVENRLIDFATMQRIKRMARYWDLFANSGNLRDALPLLWKSGSPFRKFMAFADFVYDRTGKTHQMALPRQFELLYEYLGRSDEAGRLLAADYLRPGRRDLPRFLSAFSQAVGARSDARVSATRQARHLA